MMASGASAQLLVSQTQLITFPITIKALSAKRAFFNIVTIFAKSDFFLCLNHLLAEKKYWIFFAKIIGKRTEQDEWMDKY